MPKQQKQKGNPASKRMTNANLKNRRARSWAQDRDPETGKKLKHQRSSRAQARREMANAALRASGLPTPWEVARADRARRRGESLAKRRGKAA